MASRRSVATASLRATATASLCAALLAGGAGVESAVAAPPASLSARDLAADGATLTALIPLKARGPVHFSWRAAGGPWRRIAARRIRIRHATARLSGLRPATTYRFRLVAGRRRTRSALFTTLPAPPPPSRTSEPAPSGPPSVDPPEPSPPPSSRPLFGSSPAEEPKVGDPRNPVFGGAFPDPSVLRVGDEYWAVGTGEGFPILRSDDLVEWEPAGTVFAARPGWVTTTERDWHPWAPSLAATDGGVVLFYVALSGLLGPTTNCVGVATAATPAGPYTDLGPLEDAGGAPVGCGDESRYGTIDPAPFVDDDGQAYLYVSTDWSCAAEAGCELSPTLGVIPLSPDLLTAAGPRQPLFTAIANSWEQAPWAPVVENPWVVERDGTYHLLYSGGAWTGEYGMGHATAPSPLGPFTRTERILRQQPTARGAGGGMVIEGPGGGDWLAYHARAGGHPAPRTLRIDPVTWPEDGGPPRVDGPSSDPFAVLP